MSIAPAFEAMLLMATEPTATEELAAAVGVPLLLAAIPHVVTGMRTPSRHEDPVHDMSGTEFEDYVARIARSCGVPVIMTELSGDWGVDLIVGTRPNRLAIQCKRLSRPVGPGGQAREVAQRASLSRFASRAGLDSCPARRQRFKSSGQRGRTAKAPAVFASAPDLSRSAPASAIIAPLSVQNSSSG